LAAVIPQLAKAKGGPSIIFQVLIVPNCARSMDLPSHKLFEKRYVLTKELNEWITKHYLNNAEEKNDPRYAPVLAKDLTGLPPALIVTAEFDPCRDEGKLYYDKLRAAGVPAEYKCYEGQIHPFFCWGRVIPVGLRALDDIAAALRKVFGE
jgi:acetyl esterase